jgi:site-specific recombinase XerD
MNSSRAPGTLKAYGQAWKTFSAWCREVGREALPATAETVADFVTFALYERARRCRLGTVKLTLNAITKTHLDSGMLSPVTAEVRELVRNAARDLRERQRCKAALTPDELRRLCGSLATGSRIAKRDRAMFLLQFAAGWRRSEVVGLDLADIRFTEYGFEVALGASKTDQAGEEGRVVPIECGDFPETCPVEALRAWIEARGEWAGRLFCRVNQRGDVVRRGITGETVNERLKRALASLGEDPRPYGTHSLRAGMVTAGIENGASETAIMLRTGQKSLATLRRYVRPARALRLNPLKGVL